LVAGGISWLVTLGLLVISVLFFIGAMIKMNFDSPPAWTKDINLEWPAFMGLCLMLFGMVAFSRVIFSSGLRTIRRYRRRRRAELLEPAIAAEIDLRLAGLPLLVAIFGSFCHLLLCSLSWCRSGLIWEFGRATSRTTPCSMNAGRTSTWLLGLLRY